MSPSESKLPLSVLLFHAAMQQHMSLADFTDTLGLSVATLRSYLFDAGSCSRMRSKTVEQIAKVLNLSEEEVRERAELLPYATEPFGEWLKNQMQGRFTRASLCAATKISDSAMKNYLNGQTTPDPENAMKLAEALNADTLAVAHMIVASELQQRGTTLPQVPQREAPVAAKLAPAPAAAPALETTVEATPAPMPALNAAHDEAVITAYTEQRLLNLWRRLHPQGRRATLTYIASLLAEEL